MSIKKEIEEILNLEPSKLNYEKMLELAQLYMLNDEAEKSIEVLNTFKVKGGNDLIWNILMTFCHFKLKSNETNKYIEQIKKISKNPFENSLASYLEALINDDGKNSRFDLLQEILLKIKAYKDLIYELVLLVDSENKSKSYKKIRNIFIENKKIMNNKELTFLYNSILLFKNIEAAIKVLDIVNINFFAEKILCLMIELDDFKYLDKIEPYIEDEYIKLEIKFIKENKKNGIERLLNMILSKENKTLKDYKLLLSIYMAKSEIKMLKQTISKIESKFTREQIEEEIII